MKHPIIITSSGKIRFRDRLYTTVAKKAQGDLLVQQGIINNVDDYIKFIEDK